MASKTGKMQRWLFYKIRVTIQDKRDIVGQFLAFDRHMNLIIADAEEFRRIGGRGSAGSGKKKEEKLLKRTLGLVMLRGENIVSLSIEGPPPPEENRNRQAPVLSSMRPGIGKVAGRGIVTAPPVGLQSPMPGLAGPVKGLGGPAPSIMQPSMNMPPNYPPGMLPPGSMPPKFPAPPGMQANFPPFPLGGVPPNFPMVVGPPMFPPGAIPNYPPGMMPKFPPGMYVHPGMAPNFPPGAPPPAPPPHS